MTELIKILGVETLEGHRLRLSFSDGAIKDVDLTELLGRGSVFEAIAADRQTFEQVSINPETQTIEWPGGIDLDPDVLYGTFEPAGAHHRGR